VAWGNRCGRLAGIRWLTRVTADEYGRMPAMSGLLFRLGLTSGDWAQPSGRTDTRTPIRRKASRLDWCSAGLGSNASRRVVNMEAYNLVFLSMAEAGAVPGMTLDPCASPAFFRDAFPTCRSRDDR